ncbi:hypothetical protein [Colwellia ponticola]|uniref:DUF1574 domain-containing protein n=1 Tax=Colwellia ponticola TaxID=2304625 RepID=A0A8H2JN73_9GAMM|nr:hypothetical protein [Colwellia ponticola]TMM45281.1 hypothetical protein FCS21_09320 [Colwellia ponticola]
MKYISTYFTSFAIVILSIAMVNWFIDPFGMFWSPQVESVNLVKPEAGKRSRITKAYQVNEIKPDILIVGNSRVEMGLNPNNNNFNGKIVYNQGMPGASVAMQVDYALDAMANNDTIEQLFVGVDFLDFLLSEKQVLNFKTKNNNHRQTKYDFRLISQDESNLASMARLKEKLTMIFSLDTFSASINTVFQQKSMTSSLNPLGFNNALSYVSIMNSEGIKPLFKQKLHEISTRLTSKPWVIKAQETTPYSPTFAHLGRLIKVAKEKQVNITFFINPYHFSYLHTLYDNNQWSNFQVWKKTLVNYLSIMQGEEFILWDFSGESDFVNEVVPLANPKQQMQWFWEPAHYKKELGDLLLERLFTEQDEEYFGFGVRLTTENIADTLEKDQASLQSHFALWQRLQKEL